MRFIVALLLTALLSFIASLWLDFWVIAIVAFIVGIMVQQKAWKAFLAGFTAIFLLWASLAKWMDAENGSILSQKIASVLPLGGSSILLILITGFIGGLVAGLAALSGSYVRKH
jgi:hypothetical protein